MRYLPFFFILMFSAVVFQNCDTTIEAHLVLPDKDVIRVKSEPYDFVRLTLFQVPYDFKNPESEIQVDLNTNNIIYPQSPQISCQLEDSLLYDLKKTLTGAQLCTITLSPGQVTCMAIGQTYLELITENNESHFFREQICSPEPELCDGRHLVLLSLINEIKNRQRIHNCN